MVTLVAWEADAVAGYATFNLGHVRWTRHVAELRVVVAESARGIGIGRLLLELAFEMVLDMGATKVIARMTPEQTGAETLSSSLALPRRRSCGTMPWTPAGYPRSAGAELPDPCAPGTCCEFCGIPVLEALFLDGSRLCSNCYETRYNEVRNRLNRRHPNPAEPLFPLFLAPRGRP